MWCVTFYLEILEISAMGNTDLSPLNWKPRGEKAKIKLGKDERWGWEKKILDDLSFLSFP